MSAHATDSDSLTLPTARVIGVGSVIAVFLALTVSGPTFLLQPLIENAIRHGAAPQAGACRIEIGARCDDCLLRLWVSDDGVGLASGFDLASHAGTGLTNAQSRLKQIYGADATFVVRPGALIKAGASSGTMIEIAFPSEPSLEALQRPA